MIHHEEPLDTGIIYNIGNLDEPISFSKDVWPNAKEEDPDGDYYIHDMVDEFYTIEQQDGGDDRESWYAKILEEIKKENYPIVGCSRFFICREVTTQIITSIAFTAILKFSSSTFPN